MKKTRHSLAACAFGALLVACLAATACSAPAAQDETAAKPDSAEQASGQDALDLEEAIANANPEDPYVADEVCLSCHGKTYEALEDLTDEYGDSNPHGGTHGVGGMSCGQCHTDGQTKPTEDTNMCLNCHAWPRDDESYLEYMDL